MARHDYHQQQQEPTDGEEEVRERDLVEAYLNEHALEPSLNDAINQVVADRPEDPFLVLSTLLYAKATAKRGIFHVDVREVLDGSGFPTVLVRLHTGKGVFDASCSSEAKGLVDNPDTSDDPSEPAVPLTKQRFSGRGYRKRAERAAQTLVEKLVNLEPTDQQAIDSILVVLEPEIGRNICHAVSVAACKAGARYAELPLSEYIAKLHDMPVESLCLPMPLFSVVNAGKYASNKLFVQEIFIVPTSATSFADAYQIGAEFTQALRDQLEARGVGFTNTGAFGGFAPQLQTLAEMFQILRTTLDETRGKLEFGSAIATASASPLCIEFGVDFAASEFVLPPPASSASDELLTKSGSTRSLQPVTGAEDEETRTPFSYNTDKWVPGSTGTLKTSDEMLEIIRSAIKELEIATVVDPFAKEDIKTSAALQSGEHDDQDGLGSGESASASLPPDPGAPMAKKSLGGDPNCRVQVVAKALFAYQGLENLHEERACNTILLHLHQFPTISRALEAITDARRLGLAVILGAVAGQSSSSTDSAFMAAFAVGTGMGQVKFGGLASADCVARYNELLLLSEDPFAPGFVANAYRR
ncbi:hypothetical protein Gpo141_00007178 [Globisporangium polare]